MPALMQLQVERCLLWVQTRNSRTLCWGTAMSSGMASSLPLQRLTLKGEGVTAEWR